MSDREQAEWGYDEWANDFGAPTDPRARERLVGAVVWIVAEARREEAQNCATALDQLHGQAIADAIRLAVKEERLACAAALDEAALRLAPPGKRTNQVDAHTADVLRGKAIALRARGEEDE